MPWDLNQAAKSIADGNDPILTLTDRLEYCWIFWKIAIYDAMAHRKELMSKIWARGEGSQFLWSHRVVSSILVMHSTLCLQFGHRSVFFLFEATDVRFWSNSRRNWRMCETCYSQPILTLVTVPTVYWGRAQKGSNVWAGGWFAVKSTIFLQSALCWVHRGCRVRARYRYSKNHRLGQSAIRWILSNRLSFYYRR